MFCADLAVLITAHGDNSGARALISMSMTPTYITRFLRRSTSAEGKNVSSFTPPIRPTKPPTQWVLGTSSPVQKQPDHDADLSFPTRDEVRNAWSYNSSVETHVHFTSSLKQTVLLGQL